MSLRNAEDRLHGARRNLAALLGIPAQDADQIEPYAPLRDSSGAPPIEVLMHIAQSCRADLVAQRLSVDRAVALEKMEYSRRLRDTYILYEPWDYQTGQTNQGERGVNTWAIALFAPLPVFDRNQGNIQRARLEISKMQSAVADVERQVADEVHEAWNDFQTSLADQQEIEAQVLPVVSEALAEAGRAVQAGRLGADGYRGAKSEADNALEAYRDAVVRHRRSVTKLNSTVGQRIVPCAAPAPPTIQARAVPASGRPSSPALRR